MKKILYFSFLLLIVFTTACKSGHKKSKTISHEDYMKGTFGYDLEFLRSKDSVVLLENGDAKVIVSVKYQGKVFTSTALGLDGKSFGWVNYAAFNADSVSTHINAFGGEERMWIGPEGGQFSVFFKSGTKMIFNNWFTPSALDTESWELVNKTTTSVSMKKNVQLENYSGTKFKALINRNVKLLSDSELQSKLGITSFSGVKWVGFETKNSLKNTGSFQWNQQEGALSIWLLSMLNPSEKGTIAIPYKQGDSKKLGEVATTNYFGQIPTDRLKIENGLLYFKVDGKLRSKLGLSYQRCTSLAASYDAIDKVLTILQFSLPKEEKKYINQLWEIQKYPFKGDVINAYNDGPLDNGSQLGPFYEMESSSPAAFLAPDESIIHTQRIFHFVGDENQLNKISQKLLHVSIEKIKSVFK